MRKRGLKVRKNYLGDNMQEVEKITNSINKFLEDKNISLKDQYFILKQMQQDKYDEIMTDDEDFEDDIEDIEDFESKSKISLLHKPKVKVVNHESNPTDGKKESK